MNMSPIDIVIILGFFLTIPGAIVDTLDLLRAIKELFDRKKKTLDSRHR